jgi:WD40 repeat protein
MSWIRFFPCVLVALSFFPSTPQAGDKLPDPIRLGQPVKDTPVPSLHRTSITFSPDGKSLAWMHCIPEIAPNERGALMIHLWDVAKKLPLVEMKALNEYTYACSPLRFKPDGRMLAAGCFQMTTEVEELVKPGTRIGNNVRVWFVFSGKELPIVPQQNGSIQDRWQAVAFSPDGKTMAAISGTGGQVWSLPDGKSLAKFSFGPAIHLVMSADGKRAAGMVGEQSICVWNTEVGPDAGKEIFKLPGAGRPLGFGPEGKHLAVLREGKVVLLDLQTAKEVWSAAGKLGEDEGNGQRFDFSLDGKRMAWNENGKITVLDAATGKIAHTFTDQPGSLAFSPDGGQLALACPDGTARVWTVGR